MAVTVAELSKSIRATTDDPTGTILADMSRLHGGCTVMIDRYAMTAPETVKDLALIQLAQYLYDAPPAQRRFNTNALRESGAASLLSPYRSHRLGIEGVAGEIASATGIGRDTVAAIVMELVSSWALQADDDPLPVGKLANAPSGGGLDQGAVDNRIGELVRTFAQTGSEDQLAGSNVSIDTEGFDGNLGSTDNNVQSVAQKVDDLQLAVGNPGLSQAQVDARILAAIPENRRVPGYAVGDANEYLRVNGDGTSLVFAPGMPTQAEVYAQLKEIAQAGHRITLSFDDADNEFTINVDDVPAGNSFPANPSIGERFRLLMADSIHNDALLDIVADSLTTVRVSFGSGFPTLQSYAPNYTGSGSSTLAGKTFLVYTGTPTDLATNVIAYAPGGSRATYPANQAPIGGSYPHWYEVPSLGIATLRLLSAQAGVDSQEDAAFNLDFASGAQRYADTEFATGDYTYAGGLVHWELTPGVAAPWATQGQTEPRTLLAITQLIDGSGTGLTVNNASANTFGPNTGFDTAFDLDDTDHQQGIFECEATLRFTARSANTISFEDGGAIIEKRITGFVFASSLRDTESFVVNTLTGIKVAETSVYDGSTVIGVLALRMVKDGNNVAGYALQFESALGSGSQNFAVSVTLDIAFLHNDAPAAGINTDIIFSQAVLLNNLGINTSWYNDLQRTQIRDAIRGTGVKGVFAQIRINGYQGVSSDTVLIDVPNSNRSALRHFAFRVTDPTGNGDYYFLRYDTASNQGIRHYTRTGTLRTGDHSGTSLIVEIGTIK